MNSKPLVSVRDLAFSYTGEPTISGVNFTLEKGQLAAVIGPNGGGKSTLFRVLLGQLQQQSGTVEKNCTVAYVPQNDHARLDFPVSALDVVLMGRYRHLPRLRPTPKSEKEIALTALDRVGLAEKKKTLYSELSGGHRQRTLIARALAQDADLLLLDEPYTNVDPASIEQIDQLLRELKQDGVTPVVTTHDVVQARSFDLVLCLNHRQVAFGRPAEVLSADVLIETYGHELILLEGENKGQAITVAHHHHD